MPRLSVDLDIVYTPWQTPREQALKAISDELAAIASRMKARSLDTRLIASKDRNETKLIVDDGTHQVKLEVNTVFRGTAMAIEDRTVQPKTSKMFSVALELPILNVDELYGSKLVAAMDRQHPRDLFDAWKMLELQGLTDATIECFMTYLAGHNRPIHEVLFSNPKDISLEFESDFVGMTAEPVGLETLLETRARIMTDLPRRLTEVQRHFLIGLSRAEPDWGLLRCPHAEQLPALRWKLSNLQKFSKQRPRDFQQHAAELALNLDRTG